MVLKILPWELTVCKVASTADIDLSDGFCFVGRTDREISVVCRTSAAPAHMVAREDGWRGFRVEGTLDFSLVGVLAGLSSVLADSGVGIFAVSTYDTDYILVKAGDLDRAAAALERAGYGIVQDPL